MKYLLLTIKHKWFVLLAGPALPLGQLVLNVDKNFLA